MALTEQTRMLLDMVYRVGAPRFHELAVRQARHSFEKLQFAFGGERVAVGSVTEVPMGRGDGSALLSRLYRPLSADANVPLPMVVYYHGGGWCIGDVQSYDGYCRRLANVSGAAVLSVDYRLAPENPFPAALDDALFAVRWAREHGATLGIDGRRLALAGDSAGGTLGIVTALTLRDAGDLAPLHLALTYPCPDVLSERASRQAYGNGFFLDRETLKWFFDRYLGSAGELDWRMSPMLANSLAGLPAMTLLTAECDPLTDDCVAFAQRVVDEGGAVRHVGVAGVVHGFATLFGLFPEAQAALEEIGGALRTALFESPPVMLL